ncbi:amidohydrolase [Elizabethkingia anophelis]|nr:amidohydrolase [Elizabethkingia anophelis]MDV3842084.1 amidohydrolase [Elizabethkingia anophelis]
MKIICIEEHILDANLSSACNSGFIEQAPYMADLGESMTDTYNKRPQIVSGNIASKDAYVYDSERMKRMDEHSIQMQILSYANTNATQYIEKSKEVVLTRAANDRLAEIVNQYPNRYKAFATLPWRNIDAAVEELERCINELGYVGILLCGNIDNQFLDSPQFEPVLKKLNELKCPLYLHPNIPVHTVQQAYYSGLKKEISALLSIYGWGWHNESGIHLIRLILSGVFDRFPHLNVICGHWGEMVPFFLQRMDDAIPQDVSGLSRTIMQTYKDHVYVTPSGMVGEPYLPHFEFIYKLLGADRIMYSIDYPYLTLSGTREFLDSLPISDEEKAKIAYKNAEKLLGIQI